MLTATYSRDCPQSDPPTTVRTFPSTGKICDTLDAYCPTRKLPSNMTADYVLHWEQSFQFSEAGVHMVDPLDHAYVRAGDIIGR